VTYLHHISRATNAPLPYAQRPPPSGLVQVRFYEFTSGVFCVARGPDKYARRSIPELHISTRLAQHGATGSLSIADFLPHADANRIAAVMYANSRTATRRSVLQHFSRPNIPWTLTLPVMKKHLTAIPCHCSKISFLSPSVTILAVLLIWFGTFTAFAAPTKVAMAAAQWQTESGTFEKIQGVDALALHDGSAAIAKNVTLGDGTVEFDVQAQTMGAGLAFHRRDEHTFESFYIRPNGKCATTQTCLQYAPQTHNVLLWDLFPQYQAAAPIRDGEWNHIKIVLSGKRMNVFVNHEASPSLRIGRLEGDATEGGLALTGMGYFANFTVTPGATEGLSTDPESDPSSQDPHFVRKWQLSPASELLGDKSPTFEDMPISSGSWQSITAETGGLINITRQYGLPQGYPRRNLVWIKTTITSDKVQSIHTSIGWVREVWVFVNGKPVYSDKNLFQPPTARKPPDGRCALTNGSFDLPLNAGANEVAIAIASNFYGWAVILRLHDVSGLRFTD
jgi:hypothetical protein